MTGAVVYAKDIGRMRAFYEAVCGFEAEHIASDHAILRSSTLRLVLVRVPDAIAAMIDIGDPPTKRAENPIKLMLSVPSLASARDAARKYGGELLPLEREWQFQGEQVCDGYDPEGNVVQFQQSSP